MNTTSALRARSYSFPTQRRSPWGPTPKPPEFFAFGQWDDESIRRSSLVSRRGIYRATTRGKRPLWRTPAAPVALRQSRILRATIPDP